jgi:hypothetical protein
MLISPQLFSHLIIQSLKLLIICHLMPLINFNRSHRQQLAIHLYGINNIGQSIQFREIQLLDFDDFVVGVDQFRLRGLEGRVGGVALD